MKSGDMIAPPQKIAPFLSAIAACQGTMEASIFAPPITFAVSFCGIGQKPSATTTLAATTIPTENLILSLKVLFEISANYAILIVTPAESTFNVQNNPTALDSQIFLLKLEPSATHADSRRRSRRRFASKCKVPLVLIWIIRILENG